jgi:peptide/nickel transport system substrate-binding protein
LKRRSLLKGAAASAAALGAPRIVRAEAQTTLRFIPQSDLASLDPVWTTADVTRNHAHLVFDTLYGQDDAYGAQPQMVEGHQISADSKQWDLTLRDGLKFHDGTPVLARDCVASLQRWGKRDIFGGVLMAAVDEISAPSDRVIRFRLNKPFPQLPEALSATTNMPCIMPERLAKTDPFQQVTEMVGSGPFRFVANERVAGSRVVYEKFAGYVPRANGKPEFTAGPKVAHFDRVVWTVVPDDATKAAALSSGEFDWWENPSIDLVPSLRGDRGLTVTVKDHFGEIGCLRFNSLFPPFDNPAVRRAVLSAVDQKEFMDAVAGADPSLVRVPVGIFGPDSPMANDLGLDTMIGAKDPAKIRQLLEAAGYKGERVVVLAASDFPTINAIAEVGGDMLKKIGMNVDYQSLDWGTVVQRRASRQPPDKGGWNIFFTFLGGSSNITPAANIAIAETGPKAWFGWPTGADMEKLRQAWFDAPDLATQKRLCRQMQAQLWHDAPYAPLGMYYAPTAFHTYLQGIPNGFPLFYGVMRA